MLKTVSGIGGLLTRVQMSWEEQPRPVDPNEDEDIWKANTHPLPWVKDVYVQSECELFTRVDENKDVKQTVRYFFQQPDIRLGCQWHGDVFAVTSIVVRHTHQGHGLRLIQGMVQECKKRDLNFWLQGPFTKKGKGLADKSGLISRPIFGGYYLTLPTPTAWEQARM